MSGKQIENEFNPMSKLKIVPLAFLFVSNCVLASNSAWIFAHRANTPDSIVHASADKEVNAVEIDITLASDISSSKRCSSDMWCAYHSGDAKAYNLTEILGKVNSYQNFGAVWLDVKDAKNASTVQVESLIDIVNTSLGNGSGSVRKFWGVWPASQMDSNYTTALRAAFPRLGGNQENTFIIEVDSHPDSDKAASKCEEWGLQCGLSVGNPFLGDLGTSSGPSWDMLNINYISGDIASKSHINSVFMWTFNWNGSYEDDMMRILFHDRSYWEYLAGAQWQCGQEGNGVIVGAINSIYYDSFCTDSDNKDACSIAKEAVDTGPNIFGDRTSNIGAPRNSYTSVNTQGSCEL